MGDVRHIESLEGRSLFADVPYDPTLGTVVGSFTSRVPLVVVGGNKLSLSLKITNVTKVPQRGLVDVTFVLDRVSAAAGGSGAFNPPRVDSFDAKLAPTQENLLLNLKPKGSQVFKVTGLIPMSLKEDNYWVAASVDKGGSIAAGNGFVGTVGAAPTSYVPARTNVGISKFSVKFKRLAGATSGTVKANLTNFLKSNNGEATGNTAATGPVTVRVYLAQTNLVSANDQLLSQQTVELNRLLPGKKKAVSVPFDVPSTLPSGSYFIRVQLVRSELPIDTNRTDNQDEFTSSSVAL